MFYSLFRCPIAGPLSSRSESVVVNDFKKPNLSHQHFTKYASTLSTRFDGRSKALKRLKKKKSLKWNHLRKESFQEGIFYVELGREHIFLNRNKSRRSALQCQLLLRSFTLSSAVNLHLLMSRRADLSSRKEGKRCVTVQENVHSAKRPPATQGSHDGWTISHDVIVIGHILTPLCFYLRLRNAVNYNPWVAHLQSWQMNKKPSAQCFGY